MADETKNDESTSIAIDTPIGVIVPSKAMDCEGLVSASKTTVRIGLLPRKLEVVLGNSGHSREFLSAKRRKRFLDIASAILDLRCHVEDRANFVVFVERPITLVRSGIRWLSEAENDADQIYEGNSTELLRTLRDTMESNGWESYLDSDVLERVGAFLQEVGKAEEVDAAVVSDFEELIEELELNSVLSQLDLGGAEDDDEEGAN